MIHFSHLHCHGDSSPDGVRPVESLVKAASDSGFAHLALTDHGTLGGAVAFNLACQKYSIKPILGCESYIEYNGEETGHITLLADGNSGFNSLVKIQNAAHARRTNKRPAITVDELLENSAGLVVLSGCIVSPFQKLPYADAMDLARRFRGVFGPRFFIELMTVADTSFSAERSLQLAKDAGAKLVMTNDVHFPHESDSIVHPRLLQFKAGKAYYECDHLWLKSGDKILERSRVLGIPDAVAVDAMERAYNIGNLIGSVNLKSDPRLPLVEHADLILREKAQAGLELKVPIEKREQYAERMNYELDVITSLDFSTYFIIVQDIINYAKTHGAIVGPGRGSGAGSLVLYLINVTEIDPIRYDLMFERFLNAKRISYPDIDTDFDSESRATVLEYARKTWGAVPVATYGRWSHKLLTHDLFRLFGVGRELEEGAAEGGPASPEFIEATADQPELKQCYDALHEQIKFKGRHAGGVIISKGEEDHIPIERSAGGVEDFELVSAWTQGEEDQLSYAGLVKIDLLGVTALSILGMLQKHYGMVAPDLPDDAPEFEQFRNGDTLGIFQFGGSDGITRFTKRVAPRSFEDLTVINALYRPGALDSGGAENYIKWKTEPRLVHPEIDPLLAKTHGTMPFQENIMAVYAKVCGLDFGDADIARKVLVKSKPDDPEWVKKYQHLEETFFTSGRTNGFSDDILRLLWGEIKTFAGYGFNKCVVGDSEVIDYNTGELRRIDEIVAAAQPTCVAAFHAGHTRGTSVTQWHNNGLAQTSSVILRNGMRLQATAGHHFWTDVGWKQTKDLHVGDYVATVRILPEGHGASISDYELITVGYLLSEGYLNHPNVVYFYNSNRSVIEDYSSAISNFDNTQPKCDARQRDNNIAVRGARITSKRRGGLRVFVEQTGLNGTLSRTKDFPRFVYGLNNRQLSVLIGKMWQGDGCVKKSVYYATSSAQLARHLQILLLRFGVVSTVHAKHFKYRDTIRRGYTVSVDGYDNKIKLLDAIQSHFVADDYIAACEVIRGSKPISNVIGTLDVVPQQIVKPVVRAIKSRLGITWRQFELETGVSTRELCGALRSTKSGFTRTTLSRIQSVYPDNNLQMIIESDVMWVRVSTIIDGGVASVYDLGVDSQDHNYIANGIVVHNSHSVAYSKISTDTAWWKYHHPAAFYAASMTYDPGNNALYIADAVKRGISIEPPHVNHSDLRWTWDDDAQTIYAPLSIMKYLGEVGARAIIHARSEKKFDTLRDFVERTPARSVNARARRGLYVIGAFSDLIGSECDLKLKGEPLDSNYTKFSAHMDWLNLLLPSEQLLTRIRNEEVDGWHCGVVISSEHRVGSWSDYDSYDIFPSHRVWRVSRDGELSPGSVVKFKLGGKSGNKILECAVLGKLTSKFATGVIEESTTL